MRARVVTVLGIAALFAAACSNGGGAGDRSASGGTGPAGAVGAKPFTFAAWGDTPYSPEEEAGVPKLIDQVNAFGPAFTIFVGDLHGGARQCETQELTDAADRFNAFVGPLVYTPGDNEWTDCHFASRDPLERLDVLRRRMFPSDRSFGRKPLTVTQQLPAYPENARWQFGGVVFVTIHVPGSNNNFIPNVDLDEANTARDRAGRVAANAEHKARDEANRAWLRQAFDVAATTQAAAVVVSMQADPGFDVPAERRTAFRVDGFDKLLAAFVEHSKAFAKPVVVVHGDSHRQRVDKPLLDPATNLPVANFTRVETYGSPDVGWVGCRYDPAEPRPFQCEGHLVTKAGG